MTEDKYEGCGIGKIWLVTDTVFYPACITHDEAYLADSDEQKTMTRYEVDRRFLDQMLSVADTRWRRIRAYGAYYIARLLGGFYWEGR